MDRLPARVQRARRDQLEMQTMDLESLIPGDHRARMVWSFVEGLDLGPLYEEFKALEAHPGRPGIDPPILMTLWLYATLEGVGSARALDIGCAVSTTPTVGSAGVWGSIIIPYRTSVCGMWRIWISCSPRAWRR